MVVLGKVQEVEEGFGYGIIIGNIKFIRKILVNLLQQLKEEVDVYNN
jgi:hypothetical protein